MKLIECYVSSFGKLKDFKYNFSQNLNVINEENGFGKTTFNIFIKSMFYGLEDSKRNVEDNERKKYKPWNSIEKFGGYVVFEKNGVNFKLERFFGNKESEDSGVLTDLTTGKVYTELSKIGQQLFGVDQEGFLYTTYFSQKDFTVKSNTSLTSKFNEVCSVQDSQSYDNAITKIKDRIKKYSYSGDRGLIPQLQRDIFAVEKEIARAVQAGESLEKLKLQLNELIDKKEIAIKEKSVLEEKLRVLVEREAYDKNKSVFERLSQQKTQLEIEKGQLLTVFNGCEVNKEELTACENCLSEISYLEERKNKCQKDLDELKSTLNTQNNKSTKTFSITLCLISVVCFVLGVAMSFVNLTICIISIVFGALLLVAGLFSLKKKDNHHLLNKLIEDKNVEINEIISIIENYTKSVTAFISKFNACKLSIEIAFEKIKQVYEKINEINKSLKFVNEQIESLSFVQPKESNANLTEQDSVENIKKLLETNNAHYIQLINNIASVNSLIKEREEESQNAVYLSIKKAEMQEQLEEYKDQLNTLKLTAKFLESADENLKIKYRAPIQKAYDKYLSIMTGGLSKANVDIDFNVSVEENGATWSTEYYSKGFRNLFEICKRFALIEVLFEKEKPFIMLDDPFCNLDNTKLNYATQLIKELSKEYQILYFICHDSRDIDNV